LRSLLRQCADVARARGVFALTSLPNVLGSTALARIPGWSVLAEIPTLRRPVAEPLPEAPAGETLACGAANAIEYVRDDAYRRWRFQDHPFYRYVRSDVDGAGVTTKLFGEPPVIDVLEISGVTAEPRRLEAAYRSVIDRAAEAGAVEALTWGLLPSAERELLQRLGWRRYEGPKRNFALLPLDRAARAIADASKWRVQPADIEHY
jgi:hypothetical protein